MYAASYVGSESVRRMRVAWFGMVVLEFRMWSLWGLCSSDWTVGFQELAR